VLSEAHAAPTHCSESFTFNPKVKRKKRRCRTDGDLMATPADIRAGQAALQQALIAYLAVAAPESVEVRIWLVKRDVKHLMIPGAGRGVRV
jgi:hypothetical protein